MFGAEITFNWSFVSAAEMAALIRYLAEAFEMAYTPVPAAVTVPILIAGPGGRVPEMGTVRLLLEPGEVVLLVAVPDGGVMPTVEPGPVAPPVITLPDGLSNNPAS